MSTPYIRIKQKSLFRYYAAAGRNKLFMLKQHVLKRLYIDHIISVDTPAIAISQECFGRFIAVLRFYRTIGVYKQISIGIRTTNFFKFLNILFVIIGT